MLESNWGEMTRCSTLFILDSWKQYKGQINEIHQCWKSCGLAMDPHGPMFLFQTAGGRDRQTGCRRGVLRLDEPEPRHLIQTPAWKDLVTWCDVPSAARRVWNASSSSKAGSLATTTLSTVRLLIFSSLCFATLDYHIHASFLSFPYFLQPLTSSLWWTPPWCFVSFEASEWELSVGQHVGFNMVIGLIMHLSDWNHDFLNEMLGNVTSGIDSPSLNKCTKLSIHVRMQDRVAGVHCHSFNQSELR